MTMSGPDGWRPPRAPEATGAARAGSRRQAGPTARRARRAGRWWAGRIELQALHAAWRGVGAAGRVVTVLGAAGCGKTRLLEEFRGEAQAAGGVVLAGRCHDGESELPFVLAADLLRTALSVCPELPARLPAHTAAMTGRLCPELAVDYPDDPAPLDSPMALARLYGAIGEALRTAATPGLAGPPAGVIVVEDAHWADGPSLDLLAYLVAQAPGLAAAARHQLVHRARRTAPRAAGRAQRGGRRRPGHGGGTHAAARGAGPRPAAALRGSGMPTWAGC